MPITSPFICPELAIPWYIEPAPAITMSVEYTPPARSLASRGPAVEAASPLYCMSTPNADLKACGRVVLSCGVGGPRTTIVPSLLAPFCQVPYCVCQSAGAWPVTAGAVVGAG